MTSIELANVEWGLRLLIGQTHSNACMARLRREGREKIRRFDAKYEQVLETYRAVIGREPTADEEEAE